MEDLCERFPLIAVKVFNILDDQSLVKTRIMNQDIKSFLDNKRFYFLRILASFKGNFVEFRESWRKVVEKASFETIKELTFLTQEFFEHNPKRYTMQLHALHIAAERGHLQFCVEIIEKTGDKNPPILNGFTPFHLAAQEGHTG